ncbi:flavoprotein subunit of flavocytochrome c sulfide dehydrogenase [Beggiatoa sp. PS]|nr:flavoprotein subunit of flavocytochrome c sulfide dehydrogenase [Beggiatoa sp. PS]
MSNITRRNFIKIAAGTAAAGMVSFPFIAYGAKKQVVVVGGGAGGATAAKYIAITDSSIEVTLIEQNPKYHTCFMSNEVLTGERSLDYIQFGYDSLAKYGINVVHSRVTGIDSVAKKVTTQNGNTFTYERLIVAPGIDFKWEAIDGYNERIAEKIPHAWLAGNQTTILRDQLHAMKDGGKIIIAVPPKPFRCPPGPYERVSLVAHYLKHHKPKSKILIFDANQAFSKQGLFTQGWEKLYGFGTDKSLIEWIPADKDGTVIGIDADNMTVIAGEFEDEHQVDVINLIPPQKAGKIAFDSGLTNESGWCPVNPKSFESTLQKDIHVIGDAAIASPMPKSAYAANSQAKVCAMAVVAALQGIEMGKPSYINTCYSMIGEDYAVSVAAVYRLEGDKIVSVTGAGGLSPMDASAEDRKREVLYAHSWFKNITHDMFG